MLVFAPPQFAVAHENGTVPAYFVLARTGDVSQPLWVNVSTGGDALEGVDFEPLPPTPLYFAPGQPLISLPVTPIDLNLSGGSSTLSMTIDPGPYAPAGPTTAEVQIVQDDPPPPQVTITAPIRSTSPMSRARRRGISWCRGPAT